MSFCFVFLCGEIALRLLARGKPEPVASESGFTFFSHDARLGWDLVPGASDRHRTAEFDVEIRIDGDGLRSPRRPEASGATRGSGEPGSGESGSGEPGGGVVEPAEPESAARAPQRLAALGDSFTFGHGVEARDAWPAQLERLRVGAAFEAKHLLVGTVAGDRHIRSL
ncbi:MAG: hypothetical protein AAGF23_20200, partial [Acidobacteriota bacterium]